MAVTINPQYMPYSKAETQALLEDVEEIKKRGGLVNDNNTITGNNAFASGDGCVASGNESYAVGDEATASGNNAHSEGHKTTASGSSSHAEGKQTTASGKYAHAEGEGGTASGNASHAEGADCEAKGFASHAGGQHAVAEEDFSFAHGVYVETSNENEVAFGELNETKEGLAFSIGAGEFVDDPDDPDFPVKKRNVLEIMKDGTVGIEFNGTQKSIQGAVGERVLPLDISTIQRDDVLPDYCWKYQFYYSGYPCTSAVCTDGETQYLAVLVYHANGRRYYLFSGKTLLRVYTTRNTVPDWVKSCFAETAGFQFEKNNDPASLFEGGGDDDSDEGDSSDGGGDDDSSE